MAESVPLFSQPALKDHPEQPGLINMSRSSFVILLLLCAAIPVTVDHLFFGHVRITHSSMTVGTKAVQTSKPKVEGDSVSKAMDSLERRRNEASDVFEKLAAARRELFGTDAPQTNPAQQASAVQQGVALPGKDKLKWMERDCNVQMAQALLSRRLQFFKSEGDGFFAQHPQDLRLWYEVAGDRVYGYEVETNLGHDFVLRDKSVPRRKAKYAKLNRNGVSFGSTAQGPWGSIEKLHCKEPECLFVAPYGKAPRRVWKFKGGWFNDVCDGQVWQESNSDDGPALFWFGALYEDRHKIVTWDGGRDLWVMIKPPPRAQGEAPMTPLEFSSSVILLAAGNAITSIGTDSWAPWGQLGQPCDPALTCLAARRKADAVHKKARDGPALHMIFNVDGNAKYSWLVRFFQYWWNASQDKSKGSTFTRLLTSDSPDSLMDKIPTFLCKPPHDLMAKDHYVPYNKITAVMQWIKANHALLPKDQIVVIIDVDVVLLEDISYLAVGVKKGLPMGAKGFMSFTGEDTPMDRMLRRYCNHTNCKDGVDPLAVPYFIHKDDLLALAPLWLKKARQIRKDTVPWSRVTDWRTDKGTQLAWTAEQWAYLLTAAEMGLRHEVRDDVSAFTGCGVLQLQEPMIHFSDWTRGIDGQGNEQKWNKGMANAVATIPRVNPNNKCEIDKVMIEKLREARAAIFPELASAS